jgi:hypothetical protein
MWRYDFHIFYLAGQAVLTGNSPYSIPGFISPFPLAIVFSTIAWMPEPIAYSFYVSLCLFLLVKVVGRKFYWPLLSFPVFFNFFVGQVDLPLGLLAAILGTWSLPFLIIKPQVAIVLSPWIIRRSNHKDIILVLTIVLAFISLSFLIRPTWLIEWLEIVPTLSNYSRRDANLYWLVPTSLKSISMIIGLIIAIPLGLKTNKRRDSWSILHLFGPITNIYSVSILVEWIGPTEVFLSWVAIMISGEIHSGAPLFIIPVSILFKRKVIRNIKTIFIRVMDRMDIKTS